MTNETWTNFYRNFIHLCNDNGVAPTAVVRECGLQKSVVTRWQNGSIPRGTSLLKIANYFNCAPENLTIGLLDDAEDPTTKKAPAAGEPTTRAEKETEAIRLIQTLDDYQLELLRMYLLTLTGAAPADRQAGHLSESK